MFPSLLLLSDRQALRARYRPALWPPSGRCLSGAPGARLVSCPVSGENSRDEVGEPAPGRSPPHPCSLPTLTPRRAQGGWLLTAHRPWPRGAAPGGEGTLLRAAAPVSLPGAVLTHTHTPASFSHRPHLAGASWAWEQLQGWRGLYVCTGTGGLSFAGGCPVLGPGLRLPGGPALRRSVDQAPCRPPSTLPLAQPQRAEEFSLDRAGGPALRIVPAQEMPRGQGRRCPHLEPESWTHTDHLGHLRGPSQHSLQPGVPTGHLSAPTAPPR